ncbi:major facilitator superfamily domain-containing protein 6 [Diabrotica virgifera virgifera]|uniref:Major facilitator superfamily domain-containing protein 6 n=1 Tax=Diabrotica virgifera virgifera TaxID=50390 RepID=A0A6P7FNH8_DIAVI|nr:major facilitator superfamily domain-containing protein 6 [Diabrotica virgifera virgifera]
MKYPKMNKELLPMKAHYFLWNAGTSPVTPFLSSYARQLGLSSVVVGFIYTVLPISGMLAKPIFGSIADRFHCQKILFLGAQLLTAAAFLAVFYSPPIETVRNVDMSCYNSTTSFVFHSTEPIDKCFLDPIKADRKWDKCEMSCGVLDPAPLCDIWSIEEYCLPEYSNQISFTALVPKHETTLSNYSLIFKIDNITLSNGSTLSPPCTETNTPFLSTCQINCEDYSLNEMITETSVSDDAAYGLYQFWCVLIFMVIAWIGQAVVVSVGDAICFELLGDKPSHYGYQRLWGSLGWGVVAAIVGIVIDLSSRGKGQKDYTAAFYMAALFLVFDFLTSTRISYSQKKVSTNICRDVAVLLFDVRIIVFLFWCIGVGMCTGLMWQFQFWLVEDLAKNQGCTGMVYVKTLEGLLQGVQTVLGEAPFFFFSGVIIKKLGHVNTMSLVLFAVGIRFLLYSVIPNPWYFLPIEISNGLTFGLFFACMASYASIVAPSGTEATMQGLVGAVFEGVGVSAGSYLGGYCYKHFGGPLTFRYFGYGAIIVCFIHIAIQYLIRGSQNQYSTPEETLEKVQRDDEKELTYLYS